MEDMELTLIQIKEIQDEASKNVKISCDEYHAHSALNGCIIGNKDAVTICKLCETVMILHARIAQAVSIISDVRSK